jgi:hypothetical protein
MTMWMARRTPGPALRFGTALVAILLASAAVAQVDPDAAQNARLAERMKGRAQMEARSRKEERIQDVRPARRDRPLRYLNVTDDEVREITSAARELVPRSIVNISGVTSGCPCEEGPECVAQVWVEAVGPKVSRGLQLSRNGEHWEIGFIQRWWLDFEVLEAASQRFASVWEYWAARDAMIDAFPDCGIEPTAQGTLPALRAAP